ncbi:MAG: class I SAM-dependent methyltransferase [Planctomycetaceae bacterium]|nr:class I SAM-dependent methyltransferase [Planctomycetaceae bacterium]
MGCGRCESLEYYQRHNCEAYGVETDRNVSKIAEHFGFNVKIGLFAPENYEREFFDYVTLDTVLEHVIQPHDLFRGVHQILKPGGKMIFNYPSEKSIGRFCFGKRWLHWHSPYHIHFFSKKSITKLASDNGFGIQMNKSITDSIWLLWQWAHLFIHGRKGVASTLWKSDGYFDSSTNKRWDIRLYLLLKLMRPHAFLTRFADLCGLGDNQLCIFVKK